MCIFSQPIQHVSQTCLYARGVGKEQILVYAMDVAAAEELAMILPLPVAPGSGEDAVRFIDLSPYPKFFEDLRRAFPMPLSGGFGIPMGAPAPAPQALKVHAVGSFEASFVPTIADFGRLDSRFQLRPEIWQRLPQYADFGFAVFKLRPKLQPESVHPMAFAFQRRDTGALFFPTLHVHDGAVHEHANFDHELFCQTPSAMPDPSWVTNDRALSYYVDAMRVPDLIDWHANGHRAVMSGSLPNRDIVLRAEDSSPPLINA
jgi:hypothetical protein